MIGFLDIANQYYLFLAISPEVACKEPRGLVDKNFEEILLFGKLTVAERDALFDDKTHNII